MAKSYLFAVLTVIRRKVEDSIHSLAARARAFFGPPQGEDESNAKERYNG